MRAFAALWAVVCVGMLPATMIAQEFPYTVTAADRAPLRASASETNEPTAYLAANSVLEVYRHDGNFLAVRPPEGSYSWVRASDVEATSDAEIVRIVAVGSQAWVGHEGTELRTTSQVQLQQGEKLRILGAVASANNPAEVAWYKIAPPAGEFRFLLAQHAVAQAPAPAEAAAPAQLANWSTRTDIAMAVPPAAISTSAAAAPLTNTLGLNANVMPQAAAYPVGERLRQIDAQFAAMLAQPPSTWNTPPLYAELQTLTATAPTPELRTQAQNLWWRVAKCQQVQQGYAQVLTPPAIAAPRTTGGVAPAMAQQVTMTAQPFAQPQAQGELQPLVNRIREAANNLSTTMHQQQQRTYTSSLRNRSATSTASTATSNESTRSVLTTAAAEEPSPAADAEEGGYAGTGWLMPLVNRSQMPRDSRSGVPPFALTDDAGNVKFLVTPSPGLSVSEYSRKKVGVIGPVGQLSGLSNPHLTAHRVVVLERHE